MRATFTSLFAGCAMIAVGATALALTAGHAPQGIDPVTTASITPSEPMTENANRFMAVDHIAGTTCIVDVNRVKGADSYQVTPASNCRAMEAMAAMHSWQELEDGQIKVTDSAGKTLLTLGPSDGFAYEVTEPRQLAVSLEALH